MNHVTAEEAQEDPGVILGTFLVNSTPAIVLFDCGASHSFITRKFAIECGLKPTPLGSHMLIQTPGSFMKSKIGCKGDEVIINGVDFLANLIVLD